MTRTTKRMLGYGCLGVATAPLWVPLAFAAYIGAKMTRFAFRHATPVAIALGITGVITYEGCQHREYITAAVRRTVAEAQKHQSLEEITRDRRQEAGTTAVPMLDEAGVAYHYISEGETLGGIAARVTGDAGDYRIIARENHIPDPDNVAVGTLLRIPDRLCRYATPRLYDRVPSLNSVVIPAGAMITDLFGERAGEVLALNQVLGLRYGDAVPAGERVVWFSDVAR